MKINLILIAMLAALVLPARNATPLQIEKKSPEPKATVKPTEEISQGCDIIEPEQNNSKRPLKKLLKRITKR